MKKISITIASAALVTAALPLCGGCNQSSSTHQSATNPDRATNEQAAVAPLKPVAIPPTLQTISFNDDLFGPPPAPRLQGDVSATVRVAEQEVQRLLAAEAASQAAEEKPEAASQAAAEKAAEVHVLQSPVESSELPALRFPSYDPALLSGTDFDYRAEGLPEIVPPTEVSAKALTPLPSTELQLLPSTEERIDTDIASTAESRALAVASNAPAAAEAQEVAIDSTWQPSEPTKSQAAETIVLLPPTDLELDRAEPEATPPLATPLPTPAPTSEPRALPAPAPVLAARSIPENRRPSQLSTPRPVDTREWSAAKPTPQPMASTYPSTALPSLAPQPAVSQPTAPQYTQQFHDPGFMPTPPAGTPAKPVAPVEVEPLQLPLAGGVDMQVVEHHGRLLIERGTALGQRGALFSAKTDFMHALRLVAEGQDAAAGNREHSEALARAWQTLEEAEDFTTSGTRSVDLPQVVSGHRTSVLKQADLTRMTPLEATQKYFAYAQEQLALAGGDEPVAAEALYSLGKTHVFIARESNESARTSGPLALAMQQAALMVDETHDGAANELGVLLAKYGQWNDARRVLLHAISVRPTAEKWHNLAVVHEHLGETKLAELANQESELATMRTMQHGMPADARVRWVNPEQFTQQGSNVATVPPEVQQPVAAKANEKPASDESTAWKWPWFK